MAKQISPFHSADSKVFMVRVHQGKVLRKGKREQAEESFAMLVKILGPVSVLVSL